MKPEDVLKLTQPLKGKIFFSNFIEYACPITANKYGIEFLEFKIRDTSSNQVVFHVASDPNVVIPPEKLLELGDATRFIRYEFPASFLKLKTIGTRFKFFLSYF